MKNAMSKSKPDISFYFKEIGMLILNTALVFAPDILGQFPKYTIAGTIAGTIGVAWRLAGIRKKYMEDTLPNFLTKFMDKAPNAITGVKGSKLPSGLSK
jgi:hypothetical protein